LSMSICQRKCKNYGIYGDIRSVKRGKKRHAKKKEKGKNTSNQREKVIELTSTRTGVLKKVQLISIDEDFSFPSAPYKQMQQV
jgi:hypothetical protein